MVDQLLKIMLISAVVFIIGIFLIQKMPNETAENIMCGITMLGLAVGAASLGLLVIHACMIEIKINETTNGLTEITTYYEYVSDDEYKLITVDEIDKTHEDDYGRKIYADDFGKVFIITDSSEKIFKPIITKTEVKASDSDSIIIPKYPDGYQGIVKCKCPINDCSCKAPSEEMSKSDIEER